jgi:phospholipase C
MPSSNNITVKFEDNGAPLKRSKNRHGETSEQQLRRMCKTIAQELTDGKTKEGDNIYVEDFMEGVYDIEWITHRDHSYKAARLMVAGGGPNIWVNLQDKTVDGYWGCDKVIEPWVDEIGLDDYLEEIYQPWLYGDGLGK